MLVILFTTVIICMILIYVSISAYKANDIKSALYIVKYMLYSIIGLYGTYMGLIWLIKQVG